MSPTRTYYEERNGKMVQITTTAPLPAYDRLCLALTLAAKELPFKDDRETLRKLAWHLGMNGEPLACEAIMKHARYPEPEVSYGMYGHIPHY